MKFNKTLKRDEMTRLDRSKIFKHLRGERPECAD